MAMENEWLQHNQFELKVKIGSAAFLIFTLLLYIYSTLLFLIWNSCWAVAATSLIYRHDITFLKIKAFINHLLLTYQLTRTGEVIENHTQDVLDTPTHIEKCLVCEDGACERHRLLPNAEETQPWRNQRLPQKVDDALTYFINGTLHKFVHNWYRELTDDEIFVDELVAHVRYMSAVIFQRLTQVDLPSFLSNEIIPAVITHIIQYVQLNRTVAGQGCTPDDIKVHRSRVHRALLTREQELEYCRELSKLLLPHLTYKQSTNHKLVRLFLEQILGGLVLFPLTDKICDSDIINNLIIIFCDPTPAPANPDPPTERVEILAQLAVPNSQYKTILFQDICQVLDIENQLALASFMKFMEEEGAIKYLQFFTTLDNFNKKLHSPNLSDRDLSLLHEELCKMYELFCQPQSTDYVPLEQELLDEFYHQSNSGVESIMKLRDGITSNFHSRTYDYLYQKLDQYYLPLYRQNSRFYQHWYGKRNARLSETQRKSWTWPSALRNSSLRGSFKKKPSSINKSGSSGSLKDLKSHTDRDSNDSGSSPGTPDQLSLQDEDIADDSLLEHLHNLENWRVELHGISIQPDQHDKLVKKFTIRVYKPIKSIDQPDGVMSYDNQIAFRSYNDFYTLEHKLREFHGDKVSTALPPKRLFTTKDVEFLDKLRPDFELFLQNILNVRDFQHSELLHSFLTVDDFSKSNVTDIKIERVLKSVPRKLLKERGQNLIKFLRSFRSSTLQRTPRPDFTREGAEESSTPKQSIIKQHLSNPLYEKSHIRQASNGTAVSLDNHLHTTTQHTYTEYTEKCYQPESLSHSIIRIVDEVFQLPRRSHWIFTSLLLSLRDIIDPALKWFIGVKLDKVLQEHRVEAVIHLLTDILYKDELAPRTAQQKLDRRKQANTDLKLYFPELLKQACDENQSFDKSIEEIFNVLQHPKVNKQLVFSLLDIVIFKLFPELNQTKSSQTS